MPSQPQGLRGVSLRGQSKEGCFLERAGDPSPLLHCSWRSPLDIRVDLLERFWGTSMFPIDFSALVHSSASGSTQVLDGD